MLDSCRVQSLPVVHSRNELSFPHLADHTLLSFEVTVMKMSHAMMLAAALTAVAGLMPAWSGERKTLGTIERLDPALDKLIPKDAKLEILAGGFIWVEGPVWIKQGTGGFLAFSD